MTKEQFEESLKHELTFDDEMFNSLKKEFGEELLEKSDAALDEYEEGLSKKIQAAAFSLDEIAIMNDDAVKGIIDECDIATIAQAMTLMDNAARQKIYSNMSKRAADMLKEDFEYMGEVSQKDAMRAKKQIAEALFLKGAKND